MLQRLYSFLLQHLMLWVMLALCLLSYMAVQKLQKSSMVTPAKAIVEHVPLYEMHQATFYRQANPNGNPEDAQSQIIRASKAVQFADSKDFLLEDVRVDAKKPQQTLELQAHVANMDGQLSTLWLRQGVQAQIQTMDKNASAAAPTQWDMRSANMRFLMREDVLILEDDVRIDQHLPKQMNTLQANYVEWRNIDQTMLAKNIKLVFLPPKDAPFKPSP